MAGKDQERFEHYLEFEHYMEAFQAGHITHPPRELTPTQARVYRMAALFRAASPQASQPDPDFVITLRARLEHELRQPTLPTPFSFFSRKPSRPPRKKRLPVSRRALLSGVATAASLVAGAGLGAAIEGLVGSEESASRWSNPLLSAGEGNWMVVAKLADLGDDAIRFVSDSIVGYIIRSEGDQGERPGVIAISAACTHMGCLVHWQSSDRRYHCPCHGGLFTEYGKPENAALLPYLAALPRMETRITVYGSESFIEVRVPANPGTT